MIERETRLRMTTLRLSEMLELVNHLHETLLPHDPRRLWLESQSPLELARQLATELREILGVELEPQAFLKTLEDSPAVVPRLPTMDAPTNTLAGKE